MQRGAATCPKSHSTLAAGMSVETLCFPMPLAVDRKAELAVGSGPEPRRQELEKPKPEPASCLRALRLRRTQREYWA